MSYFSPTLTKRDFRTVWLSLCTGFVFAHPTQKAFDFSVSMFTCPSVHLFALLSIYSRPIMNNYGKATYFRNKMNVHTQNTESKSRYQNITFQQIVVSFDDNLFFLSSFFSRLFFSLVIRGHRFQFDVCVFAKKEKSGLGFNVSRNLYRYNLFLYHFYFFVCEQSPFLLH